MRTTKHSLRRTTRDDLLAHLCEGDTKDLSRTQLQRGMQELTDAELAATIGAELQERTDTRTNQRNGSRSRTLSGTSDLTVE